MTPETRAVSPFGPVDETIRFTHELGDTRHRRVYYRALAISRWESFFVPEFRTEATAAAAGKARPPLTYPNPLRGPYREDEAIALEEEARRRNEPEPWRWYRVDIPATKPPDEPVLPGAKRLRTAFGWEPQWTVAGDPVKPDDLWHGSAGHWSFRRTRLPGWRVWLARPWYSSGPDEKLAVLCLQASRIRRAEKERVLGVVSRWAMDGAGTLPPDDHDDDVPGMGLLTCDSFLSAEPGSPVEIEMPSAASAQAAPVLTGHGINDDAVVWSNPRDTTPPTPGRRVNG